MLRYLRLYLYFIRFSIGKSMEFRVDFFFRIFMDINFYIVNIAFFKIIFLHTGLLGGWNEAEMMVFVSTYLLVDAFYMTFFSNNLFMLSSFVNRGDLDYYLVRPVSSIFFLSLRDFAINSFLNVLIALGVLAWAISNYSEPFSVWKVISFLILILNGTFIAYLLNLLFIIPVFWTHSPHGLSHVLWQFNRVGEMPDRIYKGWVRRVVVTILPLCLVSSFPTRLVLEKFDWGIFTHLIVVTALLAFVVFALWQFALKSYASASS